MVQTRNNVGEVIQHPSLREAVFHSYNDPSVWKISFNDKGGTRIRLIKQANRWIVTFWDGRTYREI